MHNKHYSKQMGKRSRIGRYPNIQDCPSDGAFLLGCADQGYCFGIKHHLYAAQPLPVFLRRVSSSFSGGLFPRISRNWVR